MGKLFEYVMKTLLGTATTVVVLMVAPALASAASLSLSPTTGSFAVGSTFEVKVQLNTGGATTSGTDAYIRYDPSVLEVVDANPNLESVQISAGSLYSNQVTNSADNSLGKITFQQTVPSKTPGYAGTGTLATITFQALKQTTASPVTLDYTKGSTTDSNVVDQTSFDDVLSSVTNASYDITAATLVTTSPTPVGSTGTGTGTTAGTATGTDATLTTTTGANGKSGTSGTGGTTSVAATGIDLNGYILLTIVSLFGAGYFLTRRPKTRGR